jgi:penicillin amidase
MKTYERIIFSGLVLITASLISGLVPSPHKSGKSSPQYEGIIALPGLSDSVTVYRDERGMPHIYAANEHDLYLAVGYISAQERLWQMDLIRRSADGRLSEIFGKSFLQADIFSRCLRINEKSKLILKNEDPEIVACLQAYIDGVNAFINSAGRKLPLEFRLLSYIPEPWSLEDILSIIGLMGWSLDYRNLTAELFIYQLVRRVGAEKASGLIPDWKAVTNIAYPDFEINDTLISLTRSFVSSSDLIMKLGVTTFSGSNSWAVARSRTETGEPLLSNDMHLSLGAPGIWIQMHQVIPGKLNVTGVVIPGEPFVIAGHNKKIAWGMTNLRVDAVDLYAEKINPENHNQYFFNGGWKEINSKSEIIRIKGGKKDTVDIRFTHRGPIISGLINFDNIPAKIKWLGYDYLPGLKNLEEIALSMKWSGYDSSDEARTIYLLDRAEGWDDFRSGLATFKSISQNFVYADKEGNIGLCAGGGIPLRKGNGIIIRSGETDEYDWKGYVPFDKLPLSFNPENGKVSAANNKTVTDDYPYFISHSFDMPYRINRIRQMLDEKEIFSTEVFKRMVTDQHIY